MHLHRLARRFLPSLPSRQIVAEFRSVFVGIAAHSQPALSPAINTSCFSTGSNRGALGPTIRTPKLNSGWFARLRAFCMLRNTLLFSRKCTTMLSWIHSSSPAVSTTSKNEPDLQLAVSELEVFGSTFLRSQKQVHGSCNFGSWSQTNAQQPSLKPVA